MDIPSYGGQSKRGKIAIHWFGKYKIQLYKAIHVTAIQGYTQLYEAIQGSTGLYTAIQSYTGLYRPLMGFSELNRSIHSGVIMQHFFRIFGMSYESLATVQDNSLKRVATLLGSVFCMRKSELRKSPPSRRSSMSVKTTSVRTEPS